MEVNKTFTIVTERLLLGIAKIDEIPFVFSATKIDGFNDGMVWDAPKTPDELIGVHQIIEKAWDEGSAYSFTIHNKQDYNFIGRVSIRRQPEQDMWNLGFWIHPNQQGKGYMTEATKAVIKFGFEILDAKKIVAHHAVWNKKSERVLQKAGMVFTECIEKGYVKRERWVKVNLFEINKINWKRE